MSKNRIISLLLVILLIISLPMTAMAHSGRTDSNGGHKDNKNKSGLGSYHYHCGGYPAHLHSGGVCPYKSGGTSSTQSTAVYAKTIVADDVPKSVKIGESATLKASVYPTDAEDSKITWASNNPEIATITSEGKLTAINIGTAVITATTAQGTTVSFTIEVQEITAEQMEIKNIVSSLFLNDELSLSVTFDPENTTNTEVEWISSDADIVTITADGVLHAIGVGKATITAIHEKLADSFELEIMPILAESVELIFGDDSSTYKEVTEGEQVQLEAKILPDNTTDKSVQWIISDSNIATVSDSGVLCGIAPGKVTVTATTTNGKTAELEVEIMPILAESIEIFSDDADEIEKGEQVHLKASIAPDNTADKTVQWAVSDSKVATVDKNGVVSGVSAGKVTVTATTTNGKTAEFEIEVMPILAESIEIMLDPEIKDGSKEIKKGEQIQLQTDIFPEDTTDKTVQWSVSDSSIATVDENGVLSGVASGKVTVTATTTNGKTAEFDTEVYSNTSPIIFVFVGFVGAGGIVCVVYYIRKKRA